MDPVKPDEKKKFVVNVPVKAVEERLEKLSSTLDSYMGSDHDMRGMVRDVFRELQALTLQMKSLKDDVARIHERLDGMGASMNTVEQTVVATDKGLNVLTKHFQVSHVDSCPECGSSIEYTQTMGGEMGACAVCGWSHFLDG